MISDKLSSALATEAIWGVNQQTEHSFSVCICLILLSGTLSFKLKKNFFNLKKKQGLHQNQTTIYFYYTLYKIHERLLFKSKRKGKYLAHRLKSHVRHGHPTLQCLGSTPGTTLNSSFLLKHTLQAAHDSPSSSVLSTCMEDLNSPAGLCLSLSQP